MSGCTGVTAVMLFAFLIFRLLVGSQSFGGLIFLCGGVSILIPLYNDYQKYRQVKTAHDKVTVTIGQPLDLALVRAHGATVVGELCGLGVVAAYTLLA